MSYSDYGGYAYRNGEIVEDRSDAVLSPSGIKSTPGQWPGWTLQEGRNGGCFHVLLGDGPIFVSLYKQSSLGIHRLGEDLNPLDWLKDKTPDAVSSYERGGRTVEYINTDHFSALEMPAVFEVDDHKVEVIWEISDNHYLYVKLTQPDGAVWTGFSGYGVGAGLEDAGYGYDTDEQVTRLRELFK